MSIQKKCSVSICIDVDRDYPLPVLGQAKAISGAARDTGKPDVILTKGSVSGVSIILDLLERLNFKGTFFLEGKTAMDIPNHVKLRLLNHEIGCHGLNHEDFTGKNTEVELDEFNIRAILRQAITMISTNFKTPTGFRAPYCHTNKQLLKIVHNMGFKYDSSINLDCETAPLPYEVTNSLFEVPLPVTTDVNGKKIHLYLWQYFESKRELLDYEYVLKKLSVNKEGIITLNLHSWHLLYYIKEKRYFTEEEVKKNIQKLMNIFDLLLTLNLRIVTINEFLMEKTQNFRL
ncbi:MAG: polysaccharide deacetylase family protein [Candidatus Ranarchaeia archaeon]